ncbi:MAG: hypothetical protein GY703_17565 [Gammaproteobacteria bacterium]|nr:hypothetical protein [Gammaproteobacteria bacterium]
MSKYSMVRQLENGELEIKFGKRSCLQIGQWQDGFTLYNVSGKKRAPASFHYLSLITPEIEEKESPEVTEFISGIPLEVRNAVRPYDGFAQIALIHWSRQFKAGHDLLFSNPLLLWLITVGIFEGRVKVGDVHQLLSRKQHLILSTLTRSNAPKASIKIMHKVRLGKADLSEGQVLLKLLTNEKVLHLLRHTRQIPVSLLSFFDRNSTSVDSSLVPLLASWAQGTTHDQFVKDHQLRGSAALPLLDLYRDARRIGEQLEVPAPDSAIRRCRTKEEVEGLHDRWMKKLAAKNSKPKTPLGFPSPPIPEQGDIRAIRNSLELEAEGRKMSHCVSSLKESITQGKCYIYRVLSPERGTLEVRRRTDGGLELGQFKLSSNREPSTESWENARKWFDDQVVSLNYQNLNDSPK